jgi:CBS domain-containing protein
MQLKDIMTRNPDVVRPDDNVRTAATKMAELNVGVLPVTEGDRLMGIVTDRDIIIRAVAPGLDPASARIRDVMTSNPTVIYEDQTIQEAAQMMGQQQIRRLPVLDRNRRLVGIVSLGDLAVDTGDEKLAAETLKEISEPAEPNR